MNKKHIVMIAGASMLALGVPSIVLAQSAPAASGPFADVPADHWAYQSVDTLQKAGIVIGYPDGTYGGKRAMTRYEFAVAIARLLPLINHTGDSNYATKDDLAAARADLEKKLQDNADALDALTKLVDEFQPELQKLGQDVAAIKDRLDALEARVAAVEVEQRRVKFTGALNLITESFSTTKSGNHTFVDQNGLVGGIDKSILQNSFVDEDFVLGIQGHVSDTATANVKLDFGDYLSAIANTAAPGHPAGVGGSAVAFDQQTNLLEANLESPVSLGPLGGADLVAGRFGNQWTKYTLQQVDADVYTNLYQTDSGNVTTDGAKVNLNLGPAKVNAWAGQFKNVEFAQPYGGAGLNGLGGSQFGRLPAGLTSDDHASALDQGFGVRATFGNSNTGVLGVSGAQYGLFSPAIDPQKAKAYGTLGVYGLDFNGALPLMKSTGLALDASWTDSADCSHSFKSVSSGWRNQSTDDQIGITLGALSLKGGYQYVGPDFSAPGSWGRVGGWINPTNVQGGVGSAKYIFSPKLNLNADVEGYKAAYGSSILGGRVQSPLQSGDKLDRYQVGLGYGLTSNYDVDLGYEQVNWDLKDNDPLTNTLKGSGKPTQSFITIGVGHTFNPNASFKLLYQIVEYRDKNTGFDGAAGDTNGNVAVGQFQVKF